MAAATEATTAEKEAKTIELVICANTGEDEDKIEDTTTADVTTTTTESDDDTPFPNSCYCSVTHQLMKEPVVHPNGNSMEKAAIQDDSVAHYPNRALQSYIEQVLANPKTEEPRPLLDSFYCPISFQLIREPKIDHDGFTYEAESIQEWIRAHGDSPVTRKPLATEDLYDNTALKNLLRKELNHPTLFQWRETLLLPPTNDDLEADVARQMEEGRRIQPRQLTREQQQRRHLWQHRLTYGIVTVFLLVAAWFLTFVVREPWAIAGSVCIVGFSVAYCFFSEVFYIRENSPTNQRR